MKKMSGYYKLACIEFCFENPAIHLLYFGWNSSMNILATNCKPLCAKMKITSWIKKTKTYEDIIIVFEWFIQVEHIHSEW